MTHAEELYQAVIRHCATGRGYRIGLDGSRLTLAKNGAPEVYVEPDATGGWIVVQGSEPIAARHTADSAVWYANNVLAPKKTILALAKEWIAALDAFSASADADIFCEHPDTIALAAKSDAAQEALIAAVRKEP